MDGFLFLLGENLSEKNWASPVLSNQGWAVLWENNGVA